MTRFLSCSNPLLVYSYNMRYDKSIVVIEDVSCGVLQVFKI